METKWKKVEELPPVNTLVKVHLTNETEAIDFVNEPVDKETPFQHYLVSEWRFFTRKELYTLVHKINK